jgi:sulfur-oxidizing protein SoxX
MTAFAGMTILMGCTTMSDTLSPLGPPGNAARGRELFTTRDEARCVLCHVAPGVEGGGNLGPALAGVGSRLSAAQIRLRVADITRVNPAAVMPTFHRTEGMTRVAPQYAGKPVLGAAQVEDLVAWLETLK